MTIPMIPLHFHKKKKVWLNLAKTMPSGVMSCQGPKNQPWLSHMVSEVVPTINQDSLQISETVLGSQEQSPKRWPTSFWEIKPQKRPSIAPKIYGRPCDSEMIRETSGMMCKAYFDKVNGK